MIQLTKDATASPDAYSTGDGSDPVSVALTLDASNIPPTISGVPATDVYVWANDDTGSVDNYSDIGVSVVGADPGVTWELSLNGSTGWGASIALAGMDVSITHQATQIYARATALNDGTVLTNNYITADIRVSAIENPV